MQAARSRQLSRTARHRADEIPISRDRLNTRRRATERRPPTPHGLRRRPCQPPLPELPLGGRVAGVDQGSSCADSTRSKPRRLRTPIKSSRANATAEHTLTRPGLGGVRRRLGTVLGRQGRQYEGRLFIGDKNLLAHFRWRRSPSLQVLHHVAGEGFHQIENGVHEAASTSRFAPIGRRARHSAHYDADGVRGHGLALTAQNGAPRPAILGASPSSHRFAAPAQRTARTRAIRTLAPGSHQKTGAGSMSALDR